MTTQAEKNRTDRLQEILAEHLQTLNGFNVIYDFGSEVIEGYFGNEENQRWFRVSIDPCEDPDLKHEE